MIATFIGQSFAFSYNQNMPLPLYWAVAYWLNQSNTIGLFSSLIKIKET